MASKTITVTKKAYDAIKGLKKKDESFSELFIRLERESRKGIAKYFGILGGGDKGAKKDRERFRKIREDISRDADERMERLMRRMNDDSS